TSAKDYEDELLDAKEDILDKIRNFLNSEQANIYKQISIFRNEHNSNLRYVEHEEELALLQEVQTHPTPYNGSLIRDAKMAMDQLKQRIIAKQEEKRNELINELEHYIGLLKDDSDFEKLAENQQIKVLQPLIDRKKDATRERFIASLENMLYGIPELYNKQLSLCVQLAAPAADDGKVSIYPDGLTSGSGVQEKPKEVFITISNTLKKVKPPKARIETDEDVEAYLDELRKVLLEQIAQKRKINLS